MNTVIVTNCTGRKRAQTVDALTLQSKGEVDLCARVHGWFRALRAAQNTIPVRELYVGRSVVESASVAERVQARLMFVSAGLGLVDGLEQWPLYNLTISKGEGSIARLLDKHDATAIDWWRILNAVRGCPSPLETLLTSPAELVLLALPSRYVEMVSEDLGSAPSDTLHKLRIFTSREGRDVLRYSVKACVMPYDDRLEAVLPGTQSDYPQRAMRHFVEALSGHRLSLADGHRAVSAAMGKLVAPTLPPRVKATDEQIVQMLSEQWSRHGGQSSRLLRYLRDDALVACEQGRFRDLWRQVKAQQEREASHG